MSEDKSSILIDSNKETVWKAITEEEKLSKWYVPGSPWEIPNLKEGEIVTFTLMPSAHNNLTEELPMSLTIEKVSPYREFSFFVDLLQTSISFLVEEEQMGIRVTINSAGYEQSLANLKALIEGNEIPYI